MKYEFLEILSEKRETIRKDGKSVKMAINSEVP